MSCCETEDWLLKLWLEEAAIQSRNFFSGELNIHSYRFTSQEMSDPSTPTPNIQDPRLCSFERRAQNPYCNRVSKPLVKHEVPIPSEVEAFDSL